MASSTLCRKKWGLGLCSCGGSLCGLQFSDYNLGFVPCVVYRTVLTPGALFS